MTEIDDVERPIMDPYDVIQERDLAIVVPEDLDEEEFIGFFEGRQNSWRAYAAGVPWPRDEHAWRAFERLLRKLDTVGSPENKIAYIAAQPGAGGTTLARAVAFEAARAGYPTLVAKSIPFAPDALPVVAYLTRAHQAVLAVGKHETAKPPHDRRLYETPWVIVFDRLHFEHREGDLRHFLNELTKSGRPAVVLVVTGPIKPLEFYGEAIALEIAAPTAFPGGRRGRHARPAPKPFSSRVPEGASTGGLDTVLPRTQRAADAQRGRVLDRAIVLVAHEP